MGERSSPRQRRVPPPLDPATLDALALRYLERFATTRAKLADYLYRKLRERGWSGDDPPRVDDVVQRCAALGYVDDAAFATLRVGALTRRGYGARRVSADLRAAGIEPDLQASLQDDVRDRALDAILALARRRRIGPFSGETLDRAGRQRALAMLLRAGHDLALARRVIDAQSLEELTET
jgi:regulatory protein